MGKRVQIVGAGIGGLCAALAFAKRGWEVEVAERAPEVREYGAGLQITPNGMRVLQALGLNDRMRAIGLSAEAVTPMDGLTGRQLTSFDLRTQRPCYRFMHRAELLGALLDAATTAGVVIKTNFHVTGQTRFDHADLVLGAGGIHCPIRPQLSPTTDAFFTGQVAWRAMVKSQASPTARIWMGPGRHLVSYPLRGGYVNLVAVEERREWVAEGWHHSDDPNNLRAAFADFANPVQELLAKVEQTALWGLYRHHVAPIWHDDRRAILGDSAHPTLPFLAQGANLALEDAWILAALCKDGDIPASLARYQHLRRDRVVRTIKAANDNSRNFHLRGVRKLAAHKALELIGRFAPDAYLGRMGWLYGYDATAIAN